MKRKGKMAQTEIWGGRKSGGGDGIFKGRPQLVLPMESQVSTYSVIFRYR